MKRSSILQLLAPLTAIIASTTSGYAAGSQYDQAVSIYLNNNYDKALPLFQSLCKSEPENANVHYYLALCYQQLDNDKKAAEEYEWVIAHSKDAAFKEIVQERLRRTKRRLSHASASPEGKPAALQKHEPVRRVIWFSTNWCSSCKKFAPSWEMGKTKFQGRLAFEHLNAEDPVNWKSVEKYRPKAYPTLVFLDGKSNVIQNYADAPKGEEFIKQLRELGADK